MTRLAERSPSFSPPISPLSLRFERSGRACSEDILIRVVSDPLWDFTLGIFHLCGLRVCCLSKSMETEKRPNQASCADPCILCHQPASAAASAKCNHLAISSNAKFLPRRLKSFRQDDCSKVFAKAAQIHFLL